MQLIKTIIRDETNSEGDSTIHYNDKVSLNYITRFNIKTSFSGQNNPLDFEWFTYRKHLFFSYCYQNMACQTHVDFTWFILFDTNTPSDLVKEICIDNRMVPIMADSQNHAIELIKKHLNAYINFGSRVVTVRLDSDDTVSPFYSQGILHVLDGLNLNLYHSIAIYFTSGVEYDVINNIHYKRQYLNNQFVSLVELASNEKALELVFFTAHYDIPSKISCVHVNNGIPAWCTNVHGGNVANVIKSSEICDPPIFQALI